jgi:hypothetical protein
MRDEIGAAAAVHTELGSDYDHAVAEGLVERIGAEIDRRVDARLDGASARPRLPAARVRRSGSLGAVILALGSMGLGVGGTAVVLSNFKGNGGAAVIMVLVIWIAIAIVNGTFNKQD